MRPLLVLACVTALGPVALAGCSGGGEDEQAGLTAEGSVEDEAGGIPGGADPKEVRVIEEWSATLREGDVEGAAGYFELPSIAQNGTPAIQLRTREDAIAFNRALPCGAELVRAETDGPYTVATFELTERPGPGSCGTGVGAKAKTAFLIEGGRIARWIRTPPETPPPVEGPVV